MAKSNVRKDSKNWSVNRSIELQRLRTEAFIRYLHLLPRNYWTLKGTRHIHKTPMKLYKSQNSKHSSHISTKFARSSIRSLEEIAVILGPEEVTFHSMDDKAKVPINITAAKKQTPLLMHVGYQVTLHDHDFFVGSTHKLIPSVIGDMKVVKSQNLTNDAASYFGPYTSQ